MMTTERFKQLASAYGADLKRWPEAEREAAIQFTQQQEITSLIRDELALDDLLAGHSIAIDSRALANTIFTDALTIHNKQFNIWQKLSILWSELGINGFGLVGAGLASAMAGVFCVSLLTSNILSKDTANGITNGVNSTAEYVDYDQDWR